MPSLTEGLSEGAVHLVGNERVGQVALHSWCEAFLDLFDRPSQIVG